jgi:Retrotransposon gag protein
MAIDEEAQQNINPITTPVPETTPVPQEFQTPLPPTTPIEINSNDARLPDVPKFDGNPKKSNQFISQLQVFFYLQQKRFADGLARSYYFGLRCEGSAAVWFNSILIGGNAKHIMSDYDLFVEEFKKTFDDPTRAHDAERKLLTMSQGKRSVAQMVPEFKINVFIAGWQQENLFRIFLNTLNENVRDELLKETRPPTFDAFVERAIAIDRQLFERAYDRRTRQNRFQNIRPSSDNMEVDNLNIQSKTFGKLSSAERSRRINNNLCLYCGGSGHSAQNCPNKKSKN